MQANVEIWNAGKNEVKWEGKKEVLHISIFEKSFKALIKKQNKTLQKFRNFKTISFCSFQDPVEEKTMRLICNRLKTFFAVERICFKGDVEIISIIKILKALLCNNILKYIEILRINMQSSNFEACNTLQTILQTQFSAENVQIDELKASRDISKSIKKLKVYFYFRWLAKEFHIFKRTFICIPSIGFLANTQYLTDLTLSKSVIENDAILLYVLKQVKNFKLTMNWAQYSNFLGEEYLFTKVFHCLKSVENSQISLQYFKFYKHCVFSMLYYQALTSGLLSEVDVASVRIFNMCPPQNQPQQQEPFRKNALLVLQKVMKQKTGFGVILLENENSIKFKTKIVVVLFVSQT
eukprot:snap_masked-scaffold_25-processed-gene-3.49-mRNA-1 protein AED:0.09 eAED:1.00 QI:0/0/0/1/1/1/3/0/350